MKKIQFVMALFSVAFALTSCTEGDSTNPKLVDAEGYEYATVQIGDQTWMAENLRTARDADGKDLAGVSAYANGENYVATLGRLYTVAAAQAACPDGWHLPTDADWQELEMALGMSADDVTNTGYRGVSANVGGKLKSTDSVWNTPNEGANNASGFAALPAGIISVAGTSTALRNIAYFWTASSNASYQIFRALHVGSEGVLYSMDDPAVKMSVRYVKD